MEACEYVDIYTEYTEWTPGSVSHKRVGTSVLPEL